MGLDLKHLQTFMCVAESGSVTRAAQMLHVVQPAVSRRLRLLEEDIGTELFERQRRGMSLTSAGKTLLVYARRAMLELDRARAELGTAPDRVAGLVTLGLLPSTSDLLASAMLRVLAESYPGIRLRIAMGYAGDLRQRLIAGEIDIALLYGVEHEPHLHTKPLLTEPLFVVGPPDARLTKRHPIRLADLVGRPMILPMGPLGIRMLLDHALAISNVELKVVAETNEMSIQKSLVVDGHGLTILPAIAYAPELARKRLTATLLIEPSISRTIAVALPANRPIASHVRRTVDELVRCIRDALRRGLWPEAKWIG
jgi:LysR family transcriptional regulator, nitrogen assimilation regulatory protein